MAEYIVGDKAIADAAFDHFNCNEPLRLIRFKNDLGLERIVRCHECKHSRRRATICANPRFAMRETEFDRVYIEPDGFCKWGARKDG